MRFNSLLGVSPTMRAMIADLQRHSVSAAEDRPIPTVNGHSVLLRVEACGICRTDLHLVDGELSGATPGVIPGHQIVGVISETGEEVTTCRPGDRVGIPWLAWTCGECDYCRAGRENLCDLAKFTGCTVDGGYAEYATADDRFVFPLSDRWAPWEAAPLLCAGMIGYRALQAAGDAHRIGFYGFGSAARLAIQVAQFRGHRILVFTRPGDTAGQAEAMTAGAEWAGSSDERPPKPLDAAIIFAPVGSLVPHALGQVRKGGSVVCAGIHMSDMPSFPYALLWGERMVRSVANLTRQDGSEFLGLAQKANLHPQVVRYKLSRASAALEDLREGRLRGTAVLIP
jgi:propanol-preferring alcohol dehydrogenase